MKHEGYTITGVKQYPGGRREYQIWDNRHEIASIPIVQGSNGADEKNRAELFADAPRLCEENGRLRAALDRIAAWNIHVKPGHVDYKSRADVVAMATAALSRAGGE